MRKSIAFIYDWLRHRPSHMLLMASEESLAGEDPARFKSAWLGLMLLSLCWGIVGVLLYGWAWAVFGEYTGIQLMPTAVIVVAWTIGPYRRCVVALGRAIAGPGSAGSAVVVVVLALAMLGLNDGWRSDWPNYWSFNMSNYLHWMPRTMFRAVILAPVWGAWAMLAVAQFCRKHDSCSPAIKALARGCGPMTVAMCMAVPLAATLLAFHMFPAINLTIPGATIIAALAGGSIMSRRNGGLTRDILLAVNILTQLTFIIAYLALIRR